MPSQGLIVEGSNRNVIGNIHVTMKCVVHESVLGLVVNGNQISTLVVKNFLCHYKSIVILVVIDALKFEGGHHLPV
jgi:hypothetical protein